MISTLVSGDTYADSLSRIGIWAVIWGACYFGFLFLGTPQTVDQKSYWSACSAGFVHALVLSYWAVQEVMYGSFALWDSYGTRYPNWERSIEVSMGYFVYDFVLTIFASHLWGGGMKLHETLLHHVLSITTHYYPVCVCRYGNAISVLGYLCEISTPFVHIRWYMAKLGLDESMRIVYLINGSLMALVFFAVRVVNVGFMLYLIYVQVPKATGLSLGTAMGGGLGHAIGPLVIIFYGLNLMWMRLIIKGILKALGYSKSKGKGKAND